MPFILALLMSACAAVSAYGGDFNELDALLREDARLKMELAEERAKFADEERMLRQLHGFHQPPIRGGAA